MLQKKEKVLVTGANGYIASHCIRELLSQGYIVKASLRNLKNKVQIKKALTNNLKNKRLDFCKLDLLLDNGWNESLEDCDYLLHVASPCIIKEPKNAESVIKPAVEGTLRALNASQKANIRKVVLTSSIGSMAFGHDKKKYDHNDWTDTTKNVGTYIKSKTLSEKKAWDFINNNLDLSFNLTSINPGMVFGPLLINEFNSASSRLIIDLIKGKYPSIPNIYFTFVDVRDVAKLHVNSLINNESDNKRIIAASEQGISFLDISKFLRSRGFNKCPKSLIPNQLINFLGFFNKDMKQTASLIKKGCYEADISETARIFNWEPTPFDKTMDDMLTSLNRFNLND